MSIADIINGLFVQEQHQRLETQPEVPGTYVTELRPTMRQQRPNKVVETVQFVAIKAMALIIQLVSRVVALILNLFLFPPASLSARSLSYSQLLDPIDKVNKFVRGLEDQLTGDERLPPFFEGLCSQAFYMATKRAKVLFVYLTNDENEHALVLLHQVIVNTEFLRYFNDPEVIIWGGDLTNHEGYQLANSLGVTKFPFLGLLCLTRNTKMSPAGPVKTSPTISLVLKIQGGIPPQTNASALIQQKFGTALARYTPELALIRGELMEKYQHEVMMRQMKQRYEESLHRDQLKKLHKERKQAEEKWLKYQATHRFAQIDSDGAQVAFKFADGHRQQVVIDGDRPVSDLYTYVELWNRGYLGPNGPTVELELLDVEFDASFDHFSMNYKFCLALAVPPRENLSDKKEHPIREVQSIYPSGLLVVQSNS